MADIAKRFENNPILRPVDIQPSLPELKIQCLLNPGVFRFEGKIWLLLRVAERPPQKPGKVSFPVLENGQTKILEFDANDPDLDTRDPREYKYKGVGYLSTLSHLRLVCSDDGVTFRDPGLPPLVGANDHESFGIEDCRVATLADGRYVLTYSAVSANGYGPGMRITKDWRTFEHYGMVISPSNKDCAVFEEQVGGEYICLHRPSGVIVGGHYIWLARSPDLRHWGQNVCIARTRPGMWDSARVGAGAAPIKTDRGWLVIYHGANEQHRYCLGAMLLDLKDPSKILARGAEPIMEPIAPYETTGFFGNVVFTNGHLVDGDTVTLYYGASDEVICGAKMSIKDILNTLC